jgi:hypothetical protein
VLVERRWLVVLAALGCVLLGGGVAAASATVPMRLDGNGLGIVTFGASASSATKTLTAVLGAPTAHPSAGCAGDYSEVAWHDLIVQFRNGRFSGYRYLAGGLTGISPTITTLRAAKVPKLDTATGITLGDTFAEVKRANPRLSQSGSDFWRTANGIVFAFDASGNVAGASQIYEIKNDVCPAAL